MKELDLFDTEELLVLAHLDVQGGRLDRALAKLKHARAVSGGDAAITLELARLYAQLRLTAKAKPLLEEFLCEKPNDLDALFQLGMVNYESGDLAESSRLWESVLSVEPNYPPALFYQGLLLAEAGLKAEATRHLQMAVGRIQLENLYHEKAQSLLKDLASAPARQPDSIQ